MPCGLRPGGCLAGRNPPKPPRLGLLAGHPFSSERREKAASASSDLANNFPANADLEATALHKRENGQAGDCRQVLAAPSFFRHFQVNLGIQALTPCARLS